MKTINCFLCQKDITKSTKVVSFFNYPHQYWDEKVKNWNKRLPQILNGVLCADCAQKDLEIAHAQATGKDKEYAQARLYLLTNWYKLGKWLKLTQEGL